MSRSTRDVHEIEQHEHDEVHGAKRVVIVGGEKIEIKIDEEKLAKNIKESLINSQKCDKDIEIKVVEVPVSTFVPVKEIQIVEVPVIVKETETVVVEKPLITELTKVIEVEKPIVVEKIIEKMPNWGWALISSLTMGLTVVSFLLLK